MENIKGLLPEVLGDEVFALREEYETCTTSEAKYIKALDKLESLLHVVEVGVVEVGVFDNYDSLATYADKHVQNFPALLPMLQVIKEKLKEAYKRA